MDYEAGCPRSRPATSPGGIGQLFLGLNGGPDCNSPIPARARLFGTCLSKGNGAGSALEKMIRDQVDAAERNRLRAALLAFCKQDTLAMVRLLKVPVTA